METLRGAQLTMSDGTTLITEVVSDEDSHLCLYVLLQDMLKVGDMVVGFEMEWGFKSYPFSRSGSTSGRHTPNQPNSTPESTQSSTHSNRIVEQHIALLTLCTKLGCVLIKLSPKSVSASLKRFLGTKDIVFVGVHMKEDVLKLKEAYGLVIRNVVELSEWAAKICDHPRFVFYTARELATKLINIKFEPKPYTVLWSNWFDHNLSSEQIECAATDAFAAYKVGKKLMDSGGNSVMRLFA